MIVIPVHSDDATLLILVIEPDNLERMKQGDPITLTAAEQQGYLDIKHPMNYQLVIAYEENPKVLYDLAEKGDIREIMKYISRGFKYIPGVDGIKIEKLGKAQ